MKEKETDLAKLNEALTKFGSLQKASAQLENDRLEFEKKNAQLEQENKGLVAIRDKLATQVEAMKDKYNYYQVQLNYLLNEFNIHSRQYELFCSFMAMVTESPSVTESIDTIIVLFQRFKKPGWYVPKSIDKLRNFFVRTVMGGYLKCYRCNRCGVQFIVNKEPHYKYSNNYYQCPSCHTSLGVEADDSFLKAMVSEK